MIKNIGLLFRVYLLSVLFLFLFRAVLFIAGFHFLENSSFRVSQVMEAFVMGLRFDIVITGYIVFIPAFFFFLWAVLGWNLKSYASFLFWWIFSFFALLFMIEAADIPYFMQFFERFSIGAFEWVDSLGFVVQMIVEEPMYIVYVLLYALLLVLWYFLLNRIFKRYKERVSPRKDFIAIPVYLLVLGLMFLGVRGRIEKKSPIKVGTAYFCDIAFLNQLGLNPAFTLMHSYIESQKSENKKIAFLKEEEARELVQSYLGVKAPFSMDFPISRSVLADSSKPELNANIVVVIMESMSAEKMARNGNALGLTPFLDSMAEVSYYFDQCYTAGKHTHNGIYSTLQAFPAVFRFHGMKEVASYNSMAYTLKKQGYSTTYFTTHDSQFDNVGGFQLANGFDEVVSESNYPANEVVSTLGVPDDYMFRFAQDVLDQKAALNRPFFAAFMTASDHGPYMVPDYFKSTRSEIKEQTVQYADWSLKQFIEKSSTKPWFDNTIFVFVADHGAALDANYEVPLSYFHSPLVFYAPHILDSTCIFNRMVSQVDIFPTIMGMLNKSYVNNTFGMDVLREQRTYVLVNDDNKVGVLDEEFLAVMGQDGKPKGLFRYRSLDKQDYSSRYPEKLKEMLDYAKSHIQLTQSLIKKKKTFCSNN